MSDEQRRVYEVGAALITDEEWDVLRQQGLRGQMEREALMVKLVDRAWEAGWAECERQYADYLRSVPGARA